MKKILFLFLAAAALVACNSNNPLGGKKADEGGGLFGGNKGGGTAKGWSMQDQNKFMGECNAGLAEMTGNAREVCSCVMEKMEKQYTSLDEANRLGGKDAGDKAVRECLQNTNTNINHGNTPVVGNDPIPGGITGENPAGADWTNQEKQTFVGQCVPSAQQAQGLSLQQATSYCECMTNKVAAKFSYAEANRLTALEFQKPEWQQAMIDCRQGTGY